MMSLKTFIFASISLAVISCIYAQLAPGSNAYLPPKQNGYDYKPPNTPFQPPPTGPRPPGPPTPPRPPIGPPGQPPRQPNGDDHVHVPGMPFDFQYAVNDIESGNDYAHKAESNGDVVNGEYRVQLPDGRTQVVKYTADWKTGYHAEVSYEGEPQFPQGPGGRAGYKY
ncbi:pro-resilin [Teleopsis dalmanni]|uniref:pro-resilin n=1 Tax=Teleopsis dalmanni TaxID=139649 RepID=UPI0018CD8863|nr:pro-resilin [Teleopsis dalmanni]